MISSCFDMSDHIHTILLCFDIIEYICAKMKVSLCVDMIDIHEEQSVCNTDVVKVLMDTVRVTEEKSCSVVTGVTDKIELFFFCWGFAKKYIYLQFCRLVTTNNKEKGGQ
jgi:hypothetical protein